MKASIFVFVIMYLLFQPGQAQAGFLSNLMTKILGPQTQASEIETDSNVIHNSQNVPLLESSVNPDIKNIKEEPVVTTVQNEALLAANGSLDTDSDLEKYASSTKITTYTVKKGDTIESISKKLNVPKSTIISSNADLKKSDLLKVGQHLVILALKDQTNKEDKKDSTVAEKDTKKVAEKKEEKPKVVAVADKTVEKKEEPAPEPTPVVKVELPPSPVVSTPEVNVSIPVVNTEIQVNQPQTNENQQPANEQNPSGQPVGTINGGYIWPFPSGIGRVSQGLHADAAFDFSAPKDTPILAIQSGTVLIVHPTGYNGGYGKYVVINFDDGRQAIFGHMNKTAVEEGQTVKQGDIIGYVGTTGKSTGYHTHIGFHGDLGNPYIGLKVNSTGLKDND